MLRVRDYTEVGPKKWEPWRAVIEAAHHSHSASHLHTDVPLAGKSHINFFVCFITKPTNIITRESKLKKKIKLAISNTI